MAMLGLRLEGFLIRAKKLGLLAIACLAPAIVARYCVPVVLVDEL